MGPYGWRVTRDHLAPRDATGGGHGCTTPAAATAVPHAAARQADSAGGVMMSSRRGPEAERAALVVPCESLRVGDSPRLQGEDREHVEILAACEVPLPPVLVHRQSMLVIDGMHRLSAARLRGQQAIEVEFFDGDDDEAFIAAVRANVAHGMPLTRADRVAAAARIIGSHGERSDRWIAEVTGLAAGTIAAIRRSTAPGSGATTRIGKDGRVRPLDPGQGRRLAEQAIFSNPGASLRQIAEAAGISLATASRVRNRIRRGQNPIPPRQPRMPAPSAGAFGRASGHRGKPPGAPDLATALRDLRKDPSLRYTESGRTLLRCLDQHTRGPGQIRYLMDAVPPHSAHRIAALARTCAREWLDLASDLEHRLRDMAQLAASAWQESPCSAAPLVQLNRGKPLRAATYEIDR
jgi:hypothetical protein